MTEISGRKGLLSCYSRSRCSCKGKYMAKSSAPQETCDDFHRKIVEVLAKRASYICSNPDCRAFTIAPSSEYDDYFIYNCIASHITAASSGGGVARPESSKGVGPPSRHLRLAHALRGLRACHPAAVYASQPGLPRHHARLASGCWPSSAGRGWLHAGFQRKVSALQLLPPFPSSFPAHPHLDSTFMPIGPD